MPHLTLITKDFQRTIWNRYIKALEEYKLISDGDVIYLPKATDFKQLLANSLVELTYRYNMRKFEIVSDSNAVYNKSIAPENFNDVIYRTMSEMLYNGRICSYIPIDNKNKITLIRPLYLIRDEYIEEWRQTVNSDFAPPSMLVACPEPDFTKEPRARMPVNTLVFATAEPPSLAADPLKDLIHTLSAQNAAVLNNIFASISNVDIEMLPGHIKDGIKHEFTKWY